MSTKNDVTLVNQFGEITVNEITGGVYLTAAGVPSFEAAANAFYIRTDAPDSSNWIYKNGAEGNNWGAYAPGGGGSALWGDITGTLSNQTDLQTALNLKSPIASPTFTGTVSGITKTMVGLGNVDNTSDANKPVSTATQTALDLKAAGAASSTDNAVARFDSTTGKVLQNSPATLDDTGVTVVVMTGTGVKEVINISNDAAVIPTIRWVPVTGESGLRFYSGSTFLGAFQDNGILYVEKIQVGTSANIANMAYTPSDAGDWSGSPTTIAEAINRIAAVVGGTIPIP